MTRRPFLKVSQPGIEQVPLDIQFHRSHVRARAFAANPNQSTLSVVGTQQWFTETSIEVGCPIQLIWTDGTLSGHYIGMGWDPSRVVVRSQRGESRSVNLEDVRYVAIIKETQFGLGLGVGLLLGSAVGLFATQTKPGAKLALFTGLGGGLGFGYGGLVGINPQFNVGPTLNWIRLTPRFPTRN